MFEKRIQIGEGDCLTFLEMASNVAVVAWDGTDVLLRLRDGQEEDLIVEETEAGPQVSARVGCEAQVPVSLPIKIREVRANMQATGVSELDAEQVRGNLRLSNVEKATLAEVYGNLKADEMMSLRVVGTVFGDARIASLGSADLQNVRGNLQTRDTEHLRTGRIGGNLQVKGMGSALSADQVGGNATLKDVAGAVALDQVAGNLAAKNLSGGAKVPKIGGNLTLDGEISAGRTYHFQTRGNATLRLPEGASAHVTLSAKGKILSSVALSDEVREGDTLRGTLGDGGAEIAIEAKGNIMLGGGSSEVGADLGAEISRQIEESLEAIDFEAIGRQVSGEMDAALSRLQVKLESVDWEQMGARSQQAVERAMEQMRLNMDRMVEKAARHQARVERRMEREQRRADPMEHRRRHKAQVQEDEESYEPLEPEPNLDEERLSILRMVEQGQISPEEAEMLLDALQ
ncbi:MAG TPA: hypothetical protein VLY63_03175 [Anaerolineae bacterium]|nr:hypothetical protein [Anaerolineae bacterium]